MARRSGSRFIVPILIASGLAASLHAQAPYTTDPSSRLDAWLAAALSHTPGEIDGPVNVVAPWSQAELTEFLASSQQQFRAFLDGRAPTPFASVFRRHGVVDQSAMNRALKLGALLHADVAMLHRTRAGYALPTDDRSVRVISDGRQVGTRAGTPHWTFARGLLDAMPAPPADDFSRLWYRATVAFFRHWSDYAEGATHLQQARKRFPADAVLMMYDGALHEAYADPRVQHAVVAFSGTAGPGGTVQFTGAVSQSINEWRLAEERFRAALKIDPRLVEARVRLGHVLERQRRYDEAATELERALRDRPSGVLEYYGLIFLGRAEHARGRLDSAAQAFTRARDLYPEAQSPRLGSSEVARDAGNRSAAIDALGAIIKSASADRRDPFWQYHQTHEPGMDALLEALRQAAVELRATLPARP